MAQTAVVARRLMSVSVDIAVGVAVGTAAVFLEGNAQSPQAKDRELN